MAQVRQQLITLPGGDVIEYGTLLAATFRGLFFANQWSTTAQLLQDVYAARLGPAAQELHSLTPTATDAAYDNTQEAQLASVCGETTNPRQPGRYPGIAERADRKTPYAGTWLTWFTFGCSFWTAQTPTASPGRSVRRRRIQPW